MFTTTTLSVLKEITLKPKTEKKELVENLYVPIVQDLIKKLSVISFKRLIEI